jgi:hypothetical protein
MLSFNFEKLVIEAINENSTVRGYILDLLRNVPDYRQALEDSSPETKLQQIVTMATGLNRPGQYTVEDQLVANSAFLPIIDFLSQDMWSISKSIFKNDFQTAINTPVQDVKSSMQKAAGTAGITNFIDKLNSLQTPGTYTPTNNKILRLLTPTRTLAGMKYKANTPLEGVLGAVREVGGYNLKDVTDVMYYPRKYEAQASIKTEELRAIRNISEALYFYYIERIKSPNYISLLKTTVPELQNKTDDQIQGLIDGSVGFQSPQNNTIQNDYIQFLNGKSRFLVKFIEENFQHFVTDILSEIMSGAGMASLRRQNAEPVSQPSPQTQKFSNTYTGGKNLGHVSSQQQQTQQAPTPQSKELKPTSTPLIQKIDDFNQRGYMGDRNVAQAYNLFYTYLSRGTAPTTSQKIAKGFDWLNQAMSGVENVIGGFKPF